MVIHPNKPILFSVVHTVGCARELMPEFQRLIKGKQFLFIELSPQIVEQILVHGAHNSASGLASYQWLVSEASRAGLKVVPLDTAAHFNEIVQQAFNQRAIDKVDYKVFAKREKHWFLLLRDKGADSIVVMHPEHARVIARQLGVPKENCFGSKFNYEGIFETARARATLAAIRIRKERLERRKRKARERMQKRKR